MIGASLCCCEPACNYCPTLEPGPLPLVAVWTVTISGVIIDPAYKAFLNGAVPGAGDEVERLVNERFNGDWICEFSEEIAESDSCRSYVYTAAKPWESDPVYSSYLGTEGNMGLSLFVSNLDFRSAGYQISSVAILFAGSLFVLAPSNAPDCDFDTYLQSLGIYGGIDFSAASITWSRSN